MSQQQEQQKIYAPFNKAQMITFERTGKSVLKLSAKVEELVKFLQQHQNEKGYINLGISSRREVGKYGDTHCVWLDTWKPEGRVQRQGETQRDIPKQEATAEGDDVPF